MKFRTHSLPIILCLLILGQWGFSQNNPYKAPFYWSVYENHILKEQQGVTDNYIPESELSANIDMVEKNLKSQGCDMICMDGWGDLSKLNVNGYRASHSKYWTHDFSWWSNYLQGKGMKLGMYGNPLWVHVGSGNQTTKIVGTNILVSSLLDPTENAKFAWVQVDHSGAEEYVKGYVKYYADMGIKYFRVDFLSWFETGQDRYMGTVGPKRPREYYLTALRWMREAADANGVFLSLVMPNLTNEAEAEKQYGHMFRVNEDTGEGKWSRWSENARGQKRVGWSVYANAVDGLTYWSYLAGKNKVILDPDFIRLNTFANNDEKKSVLSLCLVSGGALTVSDQYNTIGNDLWLYQNKELTALNYDGFVGKPLTNDPTKVESQIWKGQLSNGDWIIGLFNRENIPRIRSLDFSSLGIVGNAQIRDLWDHSNLVSASSYSANIPSHGCRIIKVVPSTGTITGIDAIFVKSLSTGTQISGVDQSKGTATVAITDNKGNPIEGATVSVTFSASFNESVSGITGNDGTVNFTTTGSLSGITKVNAKVTNVSHESYVYAADQNLVTSVGTSIYIGGTINKWILQPMKYENGWWRNDSILITSGAQELKFANTSNWSGADWGNAIGLSGTAKLSTGGAPNITFTISKTALYDISFNETTLAYNIEPNPTIQLNKAMYVSGTFSNWAAKAMTLATNQWKIEKVAIKAGSYELKFANTFNFSGNDWGDANGLSGTAKLTTGGKPNLKFTIPQDGTYTITFNDITLAYTIVREVPSLTIDNQINQIKVYPNPTNDFVTIDLGQESKANLEIFNSEGKMIYREMLYNSGKIISLKSLQVTGLILVQVVSEKTNAVFKIQVN
jgi:Alpha galactosidase C-terminal beta sandwich domain/Secretion system C-terminal sorting domain